MNNVLSFSDCSNCGACYNICPVSAVTLKNDSIFYSIDVDMSKCIDCGACTKACPVNNEEKVQNVISS